MMGKEKYQKIHYVQKKSGSMLEEEPPRPTPSPPELTRPSDKIDFYHKPGGGEVTFGQSTPQPVSSKPSGLGNVKRDESSKELVGVTSIEQVKDQGEEEDEEEDEEERIEQMFIGQEFDADNDRDSSEAPNSPTIKKLKDLEEPSQQGFAKQELKAEEVKIPLITHQDDTSPASNLKITIPVPGKAEEDEDKPIHQDRLDTPTAPSKPKKKGRPCLSIIAVTPLNLQQHYHRFLESGFTENPQFEYEYPSLAAKFISQFKKPRTELLPVAENILNRFLKEYGSESEYLEKHCGRVLTKQETEEAFVKYIEELNLQNHLTLTFSHNAVAPTSVVHDSRTGKSKICISMPIQYREKRMKGVMHHEIGTHFLRKYNDKFQIWSGKRKQYEMKPCIATEEGLASINQLFDHALEGSPKPYLYKGAINYYACCKAAEMSFVELFQDMAKYIDDPYRRWKHVLRVKRGMTDTSQPGGMYKDQVYLEGSVKILRNRKNIDFIGIHCGRMTVDDSLRPFIKKKVKKDPCKMNILLRDMKKYNRAVEIIAKVNQVDFHQESAATPANEH